MPRGKANKDSKSESKGRAGGQNTAGGDWYETGAGGFDRKKKQDAHNKLRREKSVNRFRVKVGEEDANIVFCDSTGLKAA